MSRYRHQFRVVAPLAQVADFHASSSSMGAITPPPLVVRVHEAPARLESGSEMDFTIWMGPLPVRWLARIERSTSTGFVDRQVKGPFDHWLHRHTFVPIDQETTEVRDEVEVRIRKNLLWGPIGLGMWLTLPLLFAYRSWKTRRLLENR
jgi:ligand-binding SRPBCC domain-containing protein